MKRTRMKRTRMKRMGKRLTAFVLSAAMLLLSAFPALAGETEAQGLSGAAYQEKYVEGLMERYEAYISSDEYLELVNGEFAHTQYMEEIADKLAAVAYSEYVEEGDSWLQKEWKRAQALNHNMNAVTFNGIIWCARFLTDKNLDQEAYEGYLMNLLSMQEKGYSATVLQQAEYDAAVDGGQTMMDLGWLTLKTAVDLGGIPLDKVLDGELWKALMAYEQCTNGIQFTAELSMDGYNALSILSYLNIDTRRKTFLEELGAYADKTHHEKLKKASETMVEMSNLRLAGAVSQFGNGLEAANFVNSASETMTNDGFLEVLSKAAGRALTEKRFDSDTLAAGAVRCGLKYASYLGPITAGLQIGGLVGSLIYGDQYEWIREVTVMYEIGEALKSAHQAAVTQAAGAKNDADRYEAVCRLVSSGEMLCLALCRGEYAAIQYMKELRKAAEDNLQRANVVMDSQEDLFSQDARNRIQLAESERDTYHTEEEYDAEYTRQAARIDKLYQSLNEILPAKEEVENNGHTVVGYRGDVYYIRYNGGSFERSGLFCSYDTADKAVNRLICRHADGSESQIYSGPVSGNLYIWKNWAAAETNDGDILLVQMDEARSTAIKTSLIKEGRIEGIDEVNGRLICRDGKSLFSVDMETADFHQIRGGTGARLIEMKEDTVYLAETGKGNEIMLLAADSSGENVRSLGTISISGGSGLMGGIHGAQVTDDYLYALYAYVAGTGFYLQEAAMFRADLKEEGRTEKLLDLGEITALEFFVETDKDGQDVLYYVYEPDMVYTTLYLEEAYVQEKGMQRMTWDKKRSAADIPVSSLGDTVYLDGAMKRRLEGELEYTTLIPESVLNRLAECKLVWDSSGTDDTATIRDVELVDGSVYFSLTYNEREYGNDFGWRPSYLRRYTRFYRMELGGDEAELIYEY